MSECLKTLETAIQFGLPVLIENVLEELEDSFDTLLKKSIKNRGQLLVICVSHHMHFNSHYFSVLCIMNSCYYIMLYFK